MTAATLASTVEQAWAFCHATLPGVSRTFALNIPILPPGLRDSVCCAYLLCRLADTVEDSRDLEPARRASLYRALHDAVAPEGAGPGSLPTDWAAEAAPQYAELVRGAAHVMAAFASLPSAHRRAISTCVREMIGGMRTLAGRPADGAVRFVCEDLADLDRYCHYVAGTVGMMLTDLFLAETGAAGLATAAALERGRRFGLGLQATNIIKDHADDVARGACYVPRPWVGPAAEGYPVRAPERAALIGHALSHMEPAFEFVRAVPREAEGVRLFCLWALMLALGTLREAARATSRTPKVGRPEVATILARSRQLVGDDAGLYAWFADYCAQVRRAMGVCSPGKVGE